MNGNNPRKSFSLGFAGDKASSRGPQISGMGKDAKIATLEQVYGIKNESTVQNVPKSVRMLMQRPSIQEALHVLGAELADAFSDAIGQDAHDIVITDMEKQLQREANRILASFVEDYESMDS